jgi:hypothetical protein
MISDIRLQLGFKTCYEQGCNLHASSASGAEEAIRLLLRSAISVRVEHIDLLKPIPVNITCGHTDRLPM